VATAPSDAQLHHSVLAPCPSVLPIISPPTIASQSRYITMNLYEILILNSFLTVDCKSGGKLNTTGDQEGSGNDEEGYQKTSFYHKDGGGGSENKFQL